MCRSALPDECFCLDCLRPLDEETTFTRMFLNDDVLCSSCRSKWLEHKKIYNINGINYHVLYEYDENLESFFFRRSDGVDGTSREILSRIPISASSIHSAEPP